MVWLAHRMWVTITLTTMLLTGVGSVEDLPQCRNKSKICKFFKKSTLKVYCLDGDFKDTCKLSCGLCSKQMFEDFIKKGCEPDSPACGLYRNTHHSCSQEWMQNHCCNYCKRSLFFQTGELCKTDHHSCPRYINKKYYCMQPWMQDNCCNHCKNSL